MKVTLYLSGWPFISKKAAKSAIRKEDKQHIMVQSMTKDGYVVSYPLSELSIGASINFVGPNPWHATRFQGTITRQSEVRFSVK